MSLLSFALISQMFALLNPLASFPFLMAANKNKLQVRKIAVEAVVTAFVIAIIITFAGQLLFNVFGISIGSLRIAGGIVLLFLGINMVRPKKYEHKEVKEIDSIISIIATPMLTGPAIISFITVKAFEIGKISVLMNLCCAFILVGIIFSIFSMTITRINAKIIDLLSRIMGLFLTAVAIEMIVKGVEGFIIPLL
ncbi:hypothetical protein JXA85_00645 [Candidatus Woesearchaeota archaeon]|nr:hypothetical protein [Candidatus Woesearchaeota archaeon]